MGLAETYHRVIIENADKRTNDWFLVGSPVPLLLLTFAYLYFVLRCGPRYMSDKRPYVLSTYIKCYNLFQVFANFLIVHQYIDAGIFTDIGVGCVDFKYSYEPGDYKMAQISWWIMCIKILDLSETFVFVLRKKDRQISFLHLYHHVTTSWFGWAIVKYFGGGMAMVPLFVNCAVHVIMYFYYFLSTCGPVIRRYADRFKPVITIIQMIQFVILLLHALQLFGPGCFPLNVLYYFHVLNLTMNFVLFFNFYRKNYVHKKTE